MPDIGSGIGSVITSESDLTAAVKQYYDRMLLETLDPSTKFFQFATKKPLPQGEGNAVIWNRPRRLGFGQKLTAGVRPSANELSTIKVSALIETYGGFTVLEDRVQLEAITDVLDMATQELAKQAAETIDIKKLFVDLKFLLKILENLKFVFIIDWHIIQSIWKNKIWQPEARLLVGNI